MARGELSPLPFARYRICAAYSPLFCKKFSIKRYFVAMQQRSDRCQPWR
jgi:hypothetical protein